MSSSRDSGRKELKGLEWILRFCAEPPLLTQNTERWNSLGLYCFLCLWNRPKPRKEFFLGCLRFCSHARAMDVGLMLQDQKWQMESRGKFQQYVQEEFCSRQKLTITAHAVLHGQNEEALCRGLTTAPAPCPGPMSSCPKASCERARSW